MNKNGLYLDTSDNDEYPLLTTDGADSINFISEIENQKINLILQLKQNITSCNR